MNRSREEMLVEEMTRAVCTLNDGGYCECVGESFGCRVGNGEPPEPSRCKMTAEALPLSAEYRIAQACAAIAQKRVNELEAAAERVLSWWPELSEATSRQGQAKGDAFADDIRSLRAALRQAQSTDVGGEG